MKKSILLLLLTLLPLPTLAENSQLLAARQAVHLQSKQLQQTDNNLQLQIAEINQQQKKQNQLSSELSSLQKKYEQHQRFSLNNPGALDNNKLLHLFTQLQTLTQQKQQRQEQAKIQQENLFFLQQQRAINSKNKTIAERHFHQLALQQLNRQIQALYAKLQVPSHGSVIISHHCNKQQSQAGCRQQSKKLAKEALIEKLGSVYVLTSSKMNNFQLTQHQLKTQASGNLSNIQFQQLQWQGIKRGYKIKLTATYTASLSEQYEKWLNKQLIRQTYAELSPLYQKYQQEKWQYSKQETLKYNGKTNKQKNQQPNPSSKHTQSTSSITNSSATSFWGSTP